MQIYWIAALGFGIVIALFAVQNSSPITMSFLWLRLEDVAVSVVVLICATLGALVTALFGLGREIRMRVSRRSTQRTVNAQQRRIDELESTVHRLEQEKAELQGRLDALQHTTVSAPVTAAGTTPDKLPAPSSREPMILPPTTRPED